AVSRFRRYSFPSGLANCRVRRTASSRFNWPSTTFRHAGVFASSKSAMNTRAPEFRALIIIFRSVAPVISTLRSCTSAGSGPLFHDPSRPEAAAARPAPVRLRALSSFRSARLSHASVVEGLFWLRQRPSRRTGECRLNLLRTQGPWGDHGTDGAKTYCLRGTWSRDGGGTGGTDDDDARDVRDPLSRATAGLDLAAPWPRDRRLPARRTASPSMRRQCVGTRQLSGTPGLG